MELKHLPNDINIEEVLLYLPKESYKIAIKGAHKRNAYKDILDQYFGKFLPKNLKFNNRVG